MAEIHYNPSDPFKVAHSPTLEFLADYCKKNNPRQIVEYGAGVGTVSEVLLANSDAFLTTYEPIPELAEQLQKKLGNFPGRFELLTDYRIFPAERDIDLLVVDGGAGGPIDGGANRSVYALIYYLENIKGIYVEGFRAMQNAFIRKALRERFQFKKTIISDPVQKGGIFYECRKTRSRLKRYLFSR